MSSIGKRIEMLRKERGVTQEELAFALDVSRQAVYQWEADISTPKSDKLKVLCEYFNVKPDYFLFENSKAEPLIAPDEKPTETTSDKAPSGSKRRGLIIFGIIFLSVAAAVMLFIAWLETPPQGADTFVSSISAHFDLVTFLQLLAGTIIVVVAGIVVFLIVKYIKKKK